MLAFALLLEIIIDHLLVGRKSLALFFNLIKVVMILVTFKFNTIFYSKDVLLQIFTILWLLAPCSWNGSHICHENVIGPLVITASVRHFSLKTKMSHYDDSANI